MAILGRGLHGEPVRILQQRLGITADGIFGMQTDAALRAYQQQNGLTVDGLAGPDTFSQMGLHELVLLQKGARGDTVKKLQSGLGIEADGHFGPGTEAAVRKFQESKGLDVDGIAGPKTLALVDGFAEITPEKVEASAIPPTYQPIEPAAVLEILEKEPPPEPSVVAKVENKIAAVGSSSWNTVKKIF
jgi:peptidoglycan hydrolase-like protein with peptidoglycan-binding domain